MLSKPTGRSVGRPEKSTPASARAGCQPLCEDAPHEAAAVLVLRVPDGFQQPPALLGGGGAGMSGSCCKGSQQIRRAMPTTLQFDSGRERLSATSNFVLMAARAGGGAGLTIHGASLR